MRRLRSLQAQILLWITLPLILVLVAVSLGSITLHQRSMRNMVAERDAKLATLAAGHLDDNLRVRFTALQTVLSTAGRTPGVAGAYTAADSPAAMFDLGLAVFDGQARPLGPALVTPQPYLQGGDATDEALQIAFRQPGVPGYLVAPSANGPPSLLLALADPDGHWAAVGRVSAMSLGLPALFEQVQEGGLAQPYLVDGSGRIIYHQDQAQIGRDRSAHPGVVQALGGTSGASFAHLPGEQEHVVGYAPLPATGWALLVEEPWVEVIVPALRYTLWAPLLVLVAAVASLIALYFGMRRVVQPLQVLGRAAGRLAWGDFQAIEKPVGGIDEVVQLQERLREMAAQIHRYQAGMEDYIAALTRTQEEERRRLARELHDETVQSLIAISQRVRILQLDWQATGRSQPGSADADAEERLAELTDMVNQALRDVRGVIRDLRPIYLEELGLVPALGMLAENTSRNGAQVTFGVTGGAERLPADAELALYRIAQAAVSNALRHAQPETVTLGLDFGEDGVLLTAEDDGTGFVPPDKPSDLARDGHFGLIGMYERATRLGGHLSIRSTPGQGTTVAAFLPYDRCDENPS